MQLGYGDKQNYQEHVPAHSGAAKQLAVENWLPHD